MSSDPASPAELAEQLAGTGYLADEGLSTVGWLALTMRRPLLLEGEPGTGKTALAEAMAGLLGVELVRLQCYEGIDASQALYDWDFPRQILHLRTVEATRPSGVRPDGAGDPGGADTGADTGADIGPDIGMDTDEVERSLYSERFLLDRPVLRALRNSPAVLLVDEVDRADDEFEAFLLEVLSTYQVTIPEHGTITADPPPVVVLTSNRTRELHDALKRRCLYHWIDHPGLAREVEIVRIRLPEVSARLAHQVTLAVHRLRDGGELVKPPGVAETLDWARALHALGRDDLDLASAAATLGAVVKYREDVDRVRAQLERVLAS